MAEEKKMMDQELENVAGGSGENATVMTVGDCNGSFLALRSAPSGEDSNIIEKLYPGYTVITYGEKAKGSAVGGGTCTYIKVLYRSIWGWVHAGFVS